MSRNGDIRGFFRPGPAKPLSQDRTPSSQPSLDLPSSPRTPPKPAPRVLSRTDEIKGSDDDEGDSDDSLESISAFIGQRSGPAAHRREPSTFSTPQAKRIASGVHRSPLTLQPKKHKFDLKALINHTRLEERIDESAKRAEDLINEGDDDDDVADASDLEGDPKQFQEAAKELLIGDEEEAKGDKIARAMKRTKVAGTRKRCYFFELDQPLFKPPRSPFPEKKAKGCWQCLVESVTRDQAFIHGLPCVLVSKGKALPDELYQWILDEMCVEKNAQLRMQYTNVISMSKDTTSRLINDMQMYAMLERLGGPRYAREHSKFESSSEVEEPYRGRDWTGLETFLQLLERIAPDLQKANVISAIQLLLRMSLDPIVSTINTVAERHLAAMDALVSALPRSGSQWDTACEAICSYLYENIDDIVLRALPITLLPKATAQQLDLRRRLAAESLFHSPGMGSRPLEGVLTTEHIRDRLDEPDFKIRHSTNFEALRALIALLDIVIGDAQFMRSSPVPSSDTTATSTSTATTTPSGSRNNNTNHNNKTDENQNNNNHTKSTTTKPRSNKEPYSSNKKPYHPTDRAFDTEMDALTFRLKAVHDAILDSNLVSRKEAKADIDALSKRLTYSVRTRPPPKTDIFDMYDEKKRREEEEAEEDKPRQRAFMKSWTKRGLWLGVGRMVGGVDAKGEAGEGANEDGNGEDGADSADVMSDS
ncbi:Uu.00g116200.m01.CDS01 [Anthostomella pinea]|uniref:Uu.00g116200.m01.CDS01 n=1 Tax=Anthostomella pinea TaxID=933095 RepID=A0AAI8VGP6_9PEZI|nr:Uu.00g116200.m01.CDS01 [Anthostomella pinea]